jgi:hypothetical protein
MVHGLFVRFFNTKKEMEKQQQPINNGSKSLCACIQKGVQRTHDTS